jgi:hypothetical protein
MTNTEFLELVRKNKTFRYHSNIHTSTNQIDPNRYHSFYKASDTQWVVMKGGVITNTYEWSEMILKLNTNLISL